VQARSGAPGYAAEVVARFWAGIREGVSIEDASAAAGVSEGSGKRWFNQRGGVMPSAATGHRTRHLSFAEREEIAVLHAQRRGVREIADELGRSPSTISLAIGSLGGLAAARAR